MRRVTRLVADPEKVRAWVDRSRRNNPLPVESTKRKAERGRRREVVAAARRRDGGCVAVTVVPEVRCWGPLDGDEVVPRGVYPGGHLDVDNVQTLCRAHHEWKHSHDAEAVERGLRRWSWQPRR